MAILHQSSATANASGTGTFTITKPAGVVSGDLLLAWLASSATSPTPPAGWTSAASDGFGGQLYYKVAGGSEPASYSWTAGGSQTWTGGISRYSGVDGTTPLDVAAQTSALTLSTASVTTTTANAMIVVGLQHNVGTTTPPAGMTEAWERAPGNFDVETAFVLQPSPGASGSKTFSQTNPPPEGVFITALRQANPPQDIQLGFIASGEQVFSPAISQGAMIQLGFIPSAEQVFAPALVNTSGAQTIQLGFIPSGEQVFAPKISQAGTLSKVKASHQSAISVVVDHEPL